MATQVMSVVTTKNVCETVLPNGEHFVVLFPKSDERKVICRRIGKSCRITKQQYLFNGKADFPFVDRMDGIIPVDVYVETGRRNNGLSKITYIWG